MLFSFSRYLNLCLDLFDQVGKRRDIRAKQGGYQNNIAKFQEFYRTFPGNLEVSQGFVSGSP